MAGVLSYEEVDMNIHEDVMVEVCVLLHHMYDVQTRHRLESIVSFGHGYMGDLQTDQLRRYIEIKQSAVAAKKTKEFRCIEDKEELEDHASNSDIILWGSS